LLGFTRLFICWQLGGHNSGLRLEVTEGNEALGGLVGYWTEQQQGN
jgi:hypothetical protein